MACNQESYDFYCWRPAAQFLHALVLSKVMTKYGKPNPKNTKNGDSLKGVQLNF